MVSCLVEPMDIHDVRPNLKPGFYFKNSESERQVRGFLHTGKSNSEDNFFSTAAFDEVCISGTAEADVLYSLDFRICIMTEPNTKRSTGNKSIIFIFKPSWKTSDKAKCSLPMAASRKSSLDPVDYSFFSNGTKSPSSYNHAMIFRTTLVATNHHNVRYPQQKFCIQCLRHLPSEGRLLLAGLLCMGRV